MPFYMHGQLIRADKKIAPPPSVAWVRVQGERIAAPIVHVSPEVMSGQHRAGNTNALTRLVRIHRRKRHMRLRKLRGWR